MYFWISPLFIVKSLIFVFGILSSISVYKSVLSTSGEKREGSLFHDLSKICVFVFDFGNN